MNVRCSFGFCDFSACKQVQLAEHIRSVHNLNKTQSRTSARVRFDAARLRSKHPATPDNPAYVTSRIMDGADDDECRRLVMD